MSTTAVLMKASSGSLIIISMEFAYSPSRPLASPTLGLEYMTYMFPRDAMTLGLLGPTV